MIEFSVNGKPHGRPRPRHRGIMVNGKPTAVAYHPKKLTINRKTGKPTPDSLAWVRANEWYAAVQQAVLPLLAEAGAPWAGPVRVHIEVFTERPQSRPKYQGGASVPPEVWKSGVAFRCCTKPDRDNADKAILDAITEAGLWYDDKQVCAGPVEKWVAGAGFGPGVKIRAERIGWTDGGAP